VPLGAGAPLAAGAGAPVAGGAGVPVATGAAVGAGIAVGFAEASGLIPPEGLLSCPSTSGGTFAAEGLDARHQISPHVDAPPVRHACVNPYDCSDAEQCSGLPKKARHSRHSFPAARTFSIVQVSL
jgi:hypothetical protein